MLHDKKDFVGGQAASFGLRKIPRLDLTKLVDVILNNYSLGSELLGPLSWEKVEGKNISFPNSARFSSIPRAKFHCRLTLM